MCGRYVLRTPAHLVQKLFLKPGEELTTAARALFESPRYNIAPTQDVPAVRATRDGSREVVALKWGLIPFWAKDRKIGARMINARVETAPEKPAFKDALARRRCVILADGFYEWQKRGKQKIPFLFEPEGGGPLAFAGLYDRNGQGDDRVESCTILTMEASGVVTRLHDRMPVVVPPDLLAAWLDREAMDPMLEALLARARTHTLRATELVPWVNDVRHDDARCVEPAPAMTGLAPDEG